jgi:hypothetical protein
MFRAGDEMKVQRVFKLSKILLQGLQIIKKRGQKLLNDEV